MSDSKSNRAYYVFLLELGIRLNLPSTVILNASSYFNRLIKRNINEKIECLYTVACSCIAIGCQQEGFEKINVRDITNISYRILHPDENDLAIDDLFWDLREGITSMSYVLMRELGFQLAIEHPHNMIMSGIDVLRFNIWELWDTHEEFGPFLQHNCATILQDLCLWPEFLEDHKTETIAAVIISGAVKMLDPSFADTKEFKYAIGKSEEDCSSLSIEDLLNDFDHYIARWLSNCWQYRLEVSKIRALQKEVLEYVYKQSFKMPTKRARLDQSYNTYQPKEGPTEYDRNSRNNSRSEGRRRSSERERNRRDSRDSSLPERYRLDIKHSNSRERPRYNRDKNDGNHDWRLKIERNEKYATVEKPPERDGTRRSSRRSQDK